MARRPRLSIAGVPQHLIQRGNNRQATLFCDDDYGLYLECLEQAALKHGCLVHAYVLMTNHVHLLITPSTPDGNSLVMRDVGRRYVQYINYRYGRSGTLRQAANKGWPLGRERFKDEIELALQRAARAPKKGQPSQHAELPDGYSGEM